MKSFKNWLQLDEEYSNRVERKCVMLLGGPGAGKSYLGKQFISHGYRKVQIDNFFLGMVRKADDIPQGQPVQVSLQNPKHNDLFQQATRYSNNLMYNQIMVKGYPFITEKTGRNVWTVTKTKEACDKMGYDLYGILVQAPLEVALQRNKNRMDRQLQHDSELAGEHEAISKNLSALQATFAPGHFFTVTNDMSPENNQKISTIIGQILSAPVKNNRI